MDDAVDGLERQVKYLQIEQDVRFYRNIKANALVLLQLTVNCFNFEHECNILMEIIHR